MQPADIRSLTEAYRGIYEEKVELTEELLDETFDELVDEFIEEGYEEEEALSLLEDATDAYLEEAKVTFGSDTAPMRASGAPVGARRKYGKRRAGDALKAAGSAVKGAVDGAKKKASAAKAGAQIAGSIAKDEARRAGRKAALAVTSAPGKAKAAVDKKKQETKKGIKGFIKRQAQKVVSRMSEEVVETEGYQPMTPERKMRVDKAKRNAYDNDQRAQHQGDSAEADKQFKRRMAMDSKTKMKREELEATGLFSEKEIAAIEEAMSSYDKNRKRAAQRAADRNAARAAGKTGVVPGVGYVTPNKERETYTDEKGTTRHKSGAKMP
tara:strand:- start:979 stop:1953 length:975 start_codon:yes stop_codon:yes gene_type:complete